MDKKQTLRIEEKEYMEIKLMLVKEGKSFQKYVMELIRKDMKERGANLDA